MQLRVRGPSQWDIAPPGIAVVPPGMGLGVPPVVQPVVQPVNAVNAVNAVKQAPMFPPGLPLPDLQHLGLQPQDKLPMWVVCLLNVRDPITSNPANAAVVHSFTETVGITTAWSSMKDHLQTLVKRMGSSKVVGDVIVDATVRTQLDSKHTVMTNDVLTKQKALINTAAQPQEYHLSEMENQVFMGRSYEHDPQLQSSFHSLADHRYSRAASTAEQVYVRHNLDKSVDIKTVTMQKCQPGFLAKIDPWTGQKTFLPQSTVAGVRQDFKDGKPVLVPHNEWSMTHCMVDHHFYHHDCEQVAKLASYRAAAGNKPDLYHVRPTLRQLILNSPFVHAPPALLHANAHSAAAQPKFHYQIKVIAMPASLPEASQTLRAFFLQHPELSAHSALRLFCIA